MKAAILPVLFLAVAVLSSGQARAGEIEIREFVSKDGEKSFWGTLTNYDPDAGMVTVVRDRKSIKFSEDLLSEEDQEWVKEQYEFMKVRSNVKIRVNSKHGSRKVAKTSGQKSISSSKYFDIQITNSGDSVSDLRVEYEIHVSRNGEREVIDGKPQQISTLFSGLPHSFQTEEIALSQKIPLSTYVVTNNNGTDSKGSGGAANSNGRASRGGRACPT